MDKLLLLLLRDCLDTTPRYALVYAEVGDPRASEQE